MIKRFFSLGLLLLVILLALTYFWWQWAVSPVQPKNTQEQIFIVPQGQNAKTIGRRLLQQGFIKSQLAFQLLVDRKNYASRLQAGDFRLSPSMDLTTIIDSLTHGSLDYWITFPEGLRVEEYATLLSTKADIDPQQFILAAKPFAGRLFPDTYLIPQNASARDIINILTRNFDKKFTPLKKDLVKTGLSEQEIIILASLIEREAKHEQDRPLVSSVLHNRLKINMALQIDATVQYVVGRPGDWWPKHLSQADLQAPSPYNTYIHSGLPPAPIANPGLSSLQAAVNPATTNYLYYVSDSAGYNHYAESLAEHNLNITKYLNQQTP
jgi:UPF0755 protein